MDITQKVKGQPAVKRTLLNQLGALLLFVVVGGALAMADSYTR